MNIHKQQTWFSHSHGTTASFISWVVHHTTHVYGRVTRKNTSFAGSEHISPNKEGGEHNWAQLESLQLFAWSTGKSEGVSGLCFWDWGLSGWRWRGIRLRTRMRVKMSSM